MLLQKTQMKLPKSKYWRVPKIWNESTAYIIGGGPSVLSTNLDLIKSKRVIGCNDAYSFGNWVDICYFGDWYWFIKHWRKEVTREDGSTHPGLKAFTGLRISNNKQITYPHLPGIKILRRFGDGLITIPGAIAWNGNTGASAINLAVNLGAKRIVLIGFDMAFKDGKSNWHEPLKKEPDPDCYEKRFMPNMNSMIKPLKQLNIEVLNATPGSKLDIFPMVKLEDVV